MAVILVVEDDTAAAQVLAKLLRYQGHRVNCVPDGLQGLQALEKEKPDVVLLDMMMPVMDGVELLSRIRERDDLKDQRVIMLSAVSSGPEVDRARELGVEAYFVKGSPYYPELLARLEAGAAKRG